MLNHKDDYKSGRSNILMTSVFTPESAFLKIYASFMLLHAIFATTKQIEFQSVSPKFSITKMTFYDLDPDQARQNVGSDLDTN